MSLKIQTSVRVELRLIQASVCISSLQCVVDQWRSDGVHIVE